MLNRVRKKVIKHVFHILGFPHDKILRKAKNLKPLSFDSLKFSKSNNHCF